MYPYNNQFRDLRSLHNLHATIGIGSGIGIGRQALMHGPGLWSIRGRIPTPYARISRRPQPRPREYSERLRQSQMPMRNFPAPFEQQRSNSGIGGTADNSNVSTHSTVRWLNNSIKLLEPTNTHTRLYSNSANLISVSNQTRASATKLAVAAAAAAAAAQTCDSKSNPSSNGAKSETRVLELQLQLELETKSTPISDSNQSSDVAENETRIPNVPSTESECSNVDKCTETETDTPDGPGGISVSESDLVSISTPPPWLKSGNESATNELDSRSAEKISTITITNPRIPGIPGGTSSIRDTATEEEDSIMEGIEQLPNETTEPKVASWSSVLEELQSSKESEEKPGFKGRERGRGRGRGIAANKRQQRRRRRRRRRNDFRQLQRGMKRFSIGEFAGAGPTSSSNIYADYIANLHHGGGGGNFAACTAHASFSAPRPSPHFYGNPTNRWNTQQPSRIMLVPRTFNPAAARPRFPFIGERPVFGAHRWSGTWPYYNIRSRRPIGRDSASWATDGSNRPASS